MKPFDWMSLTFYGWWQVDTEGPIAIDQFYVSYHGEPLPGPMVLLLRNSLQYQLSLAEVGKEESY